MSVPAVDGSNISALIAAFKVAAAPVPLARPLDPVARAEPVTPAVPLPVGAVAPVSPPTSDDATLVTITARPPVPPIAPEAPDAVFAAASARSAIDAAYLVAAGGDRLAAALLARKPVEELFAALDRRQLFAAAHLPGDLFTAAERKLALLLLARPAEPLLALLRASAPRGDLAAAVAAYAAQLDAAGPEERRSAEWTIERVAVQRFLDREGVARATTADLGVRGPVDGDPAGRSPAMAQLRTALDAVAAGASRATADLAGAAVRDMPLLGTPILTPEMLLAGLAALGRTVDPRRHVDRPAIRERRPRRDRRPEPLIRPLGADWEEDVDLGLNIDAWEAEHGVLLPADHRAFLIAFDGGRVYPNMFDYSVPLTGLSSTAAATFLDRLYGFEQVAASWGGGAFGRAFPPGFVTIGADPGGMEILLSLEGRDHGSVWCWLHSKDAWGSIRNHEIYRLADCFDDFIDGLRDEPGGAGWRYWSRPALKRLERPLEF
ncbi:SMI1/KNR4 family protein [Chelatococcus sambhunathii]|uniref:SMI1/KNR4 family protein n=1 Tax=Chelatococcus sambhunathii TaxID=363953 RepID=A0ABU1DAI9_9HYPH|nr:SMI1/KNR4 family protein [Chelatococcus sambhunathii]MDR4305087.1 SMI1/KNR4 family protein [Chelatococcus sambhunathii]